MSRKRVLLGLSIIAGGVCAALPFRHELPVSIPAPASPAASVPENANPLLQPAIAGATSPSVASQQTLAAPIAPSPYIDDGSQRLERENDTHISSPPPPEEIAALARPNSTEPPMLPVSFQVKQLDESHTGPWQPAKLAEGPAGPPREYRIRKLDTLEDLAERFLGSQDRATELFEANRGVLKDRHILPLGAVIRIPLSGVESPSGSESELQPVRPQPER